MPSRPGDWRDLDLGARLAILAGPWLCFGMLALALLPAPRAVGAFVSTYAQLMPWHDAKGLWEGFFRSLRTQSIDVVLGVVAAKYVAVNLLPLPSLAGGQILSELATELCGARAPMARVVTSLRVVSTLVVLAMWINIAVGFVRALVAS